MNSTITELPADKHDSQGGATLCRGLACFGWQGWWRRELPWQPRAADEMGVGNLTLGAAELVMKRVFGSYLSAVASFSGGRPHSGRNFQQISSGEIFVLRGGNQIDSWEATLTSFGGRHQCRCPHHQRKLILIIRVSSNFPISLAFHAIWYAYCFTFNEPTEGSRGLME